MTRVVVIGSGFGARVAAPAWRAAGAEVVDVRSARALDVDRVITAARPDVVSVHSPPFLHAGHVEAAVTAGAIVLCDKPTTPAAPMTQALIGRLGASAERVYVNFEFRFEPARVELRRLMRSAAIGAITRITWIHHSNGSIEPLRPFGWLFDASLGGGWIGAWASHAIDALHSWLDEPLSVQTSEPRIDVPVRFDGDGMPREVTAEDGLVAELRTPSGVRILLDSTFASSDPSPPTIIVEGTDGTITNIADRRLVIDSDSEGPRSWNRTAGRSADRHDAPMRALATALLGSVRRGEGVASDHSALETTPLPTLADGLRVDRVLDELRVGRAH